VEWAPGIEENSPVTLVVSGVRLERLDWIAEKATELGVSRLVLVASARVQGFRASAERAERLVRVAREAAKQSERSRWPDVDGPVGLPEALGEQARHRIFLDFDGEPFSFGICLGRPLCSWPRGWSEMERSAARERRMDSSVPARGQTPGRNGTIAGLVLRARPSNP
jgi:hypothetical protein